MSVYSDEQLRDAVEFAFEVLRATPTVAATYRLPKAMQQHLRAGKPTRASLKSLRTLLEERNDVRSALGAAVANIPEDERSTLDEVVLLWLCRPDGWEDRLAAVLAERAAAKRAEREQAAEATAARRLRGTEAHLERTRAELESALAALAGCEADLARERQRQIELEAQVVSLERRLDEADAHSRRIGAVAERSAAELAAARDHLDDALGEVASLHAEIASFEERLRDALAGRAAADAAAASLREAALAAPSPQSGDQPDRRQTNRLQRAPVPVPGGRLESDVETVDYLVRLPGLTVVVDGYNVSHEIWPELLLEEQRVRLLASLENLVARTNARVRLVFDAAEGTPGWRIERRLVQVEFSPEGVIADDHIRHIVRSMPPDHKVLVVSTDRALTASVRSLGANTVASAAFATYLLR